MPTAECEQEFEVLESIYKEISIIPETDNGDSLVSILLYPKSAGDVESRYVTLMLEFYLQPTYPATLPVVKLRNPRGLSEEQVNGLNQNIRQTSEEFTGVPMLFQLIDMVQDYLTANNRPAAECPICLMSFTDFDVFYTPACYHHYHSHCLGLHLKSLVNNHAETMETRNPAAEIELLCPVCRVGLDPNIDIGKLISAPPATEESLELVESYVENGCHDRDKLDALFRKQQKQGGIIDLNEDCKLLRISDPLETNSHSRMQTNIVADPTLETRGNAIYPAEHDEHRKIPQVHNSRHKSVHSHQHKPFRESSGSSSMSNRGSQHHPGHGRGRQDTHRHQHHVSAITGSSGATSLTSKHGSSNAPLTSRTVETGRDSRTGSCGISGGLKRRPKDI